MPLANEDLLAISALMDNKLTPISTRLKGIEDSQQHFFDRQKIKPIGFHCNPYYGYQPNHGSISQQPPNQGTSVQPPKARHS